MRIIDADKFLKYLIFSKHIDGLTCGEVKEAIEMCKVDILDKIRAEIRDWQTDIHDNDYDADIHDFVFERIYEIIDEYRAESEEEDGNDG